MGSSQQFSLRWNNYLRHITSAFDSLRSDLDLVDVTLSCEGKKIKAHKMLLSACSTYFKDLFKENPCQHPVIIFRNVKFADLEALIDFIYQGEVNVVQEQLASFLTTAELLAVQGLTDGAGQDLAENLNEENVEANVDTIPEEVLPVENKRSSSNTNSHLFTTPNQNPPSPPAKRKKWSAPATQNSSLKRTETNESRRLQPSTSNNSVNLVPEMSQVKVEMPEFLDVESGQISYNNAEQDENPLEALDGIEHSIASASGGKEESMDVFGGGSNDEGDLTGDHLTPAELSQVLSKAGPSSEGSQDSLQAPVPGPAGASWQTMARRQMARAMGAQTGALGPPLASMASMSPMASPQISPSRAVPRNLAGRERYSCQFCDKTFAHRISVALHMSCHQGKTVCPVCHKVFSRAYNLKLHLKTVHCDVQPGLLQQKAEPPL